MKAAAIRFAKSIADEHDSDGMMRNPRLVEAASKAHVSTKIKDAGRDLLSKCVLLF